MVTPSHKKLQIPDKYGREAPWPAAQAEILNINVYKVSILTYMSISKAYPKWSLGVIKSYRFQIKYGREAPWPAAQAEILNINVYKVSMI